MKKAFFCVLIFISLLFGCVSTEHNSHYADLAQEHPFEYFFPDHNVALTFSTIDEAYEYINTADRKFAQTMQKFYRAKGLAARLSGPMPNDGSVNVVVGIRASQVRKEGGINKGVFIDLSKISDPQYLMSIGFPYIENPTLETFLKKVDGDALLIFFIFYNGKAVSFPNYYLARKYTGGYLEGNRQPHNFTVSGNTYEANYPIGWGIEQSFQYLRGERQ